LDELVPLFVAEYNAKAGRRVKDVPDDVWNKLKAALLAGQCQGVYAMSLERCVLFSDGATFPGQWLQLPGQHSQTDASEQGRINTQRKPMTGYLFAFRRQYGAG